MSQKSTPCLCHLQHVILRQSSDPKIAAVRTGLTHSKSLPACAVLKCSLQLHAPTVACVALHELTRVGDKEQGSDEIWAEVARAEIQWVCLSGYPKSVSEFQWPVLLLESACWGQCWPRASPAELLERQGGFFFGLNYLTVLPTVMKPTL